jgi:hypothetical protein
MEGYINLGNIDEIAESGLSRSSIRKLVQRSRRVSENKKFELI